jgi:tetratricopeptide (TPR) repeat protein
MKRRTIMRVRTLVGCALLMPLLGGGFVAAHEDGIDKTRLGSVKFENSCNAAVQADLMRAVAMLHSFWYSAGEETFREVLANDPECAIATWGIASIMMNNPLAGQGASPKGAETAQAAIAQGRGIGAKTQRERDYLEAVAAYYDDFGNRPERSRQETRAKAYEALAARYPNDDEAQIFAALYVAATQSQADQTYAAYLKAAAVLEKEFAKYPDHPGVAHYLIHSYDAPPIAGQGLTAARKYSAIAPDAPHALHMPSHIFTRVGAWQESASTNSRSASVAVKGNEPDEAYHASDYSVYALLQLARDAEARRTIEDAMKVNGASPARFVAPYAIAAMPARYAIERNAWADAMKLEVQSTRYPFTEAITCFARGLGAARSGDVPAAEKNAEQLAVLHKALQDAKNTYWATEVEVQRLALSGWIALAQHKNDDALRFMRAAADLEDKSDKHIVTPGRIVPARELVGDMLMELAQPAAALHEYELSQAREPNRFRGYAGAARAAEAAGQPDKARKYYNDLIALARNADSPRPELERARTYLAQR